MKIENIDIINLILDREFVNKLNIPLIECFKPFDRYFSFATDSFWLPPKSDFGNLSLSLFNIVDRFDLINLDIIKLFKEFNLLKTQREQGNYMIASNRSALQPFLMEQIIYWLRKTADELIAIIWILKYYTDNNEYPVQIKVESIGSHLHCEDLSNELKEFNDILKTINDISNAYKHSLVNSQIYAHRGKEEPLVFAYRLPYNDRRKKADFHIVSFRELIEGYKGFINHCKNILKDFSDKLKEREEIKTK